MKKVVGVGVVANVRCWDREISVAETVGWPVVVEARRWRRERI